MSSRVYYVSGKSRMILKPVRPTPCASYQWISASRILPSTSRTVAMPFSFRQKTRRRWRGGGLLAATQALFLLSTFRVDHLRIAQELVEEADQNRVGDAAVAGNELGIDREDPERVRRRRDS